MESIPPILQIFIETHLTTLLHWFSGEIYRRLLERNGSHFLFQLDDHLDTGPLEAACAGYHHGRGPGAPPVHSVARLVRALLVKYLLDLSLRELEAEIRWKLPVKWFVGYALFEPGPDHTTLERFEMWVIEHHSRIFFDEVLRQIHQAFPEERQKTQMGDTYALRANGATESLIQLIRHSCQLLLTAVDADEDRRQIESQLDLIALWGDPEEVKEFRLERQQRQERLRTTVIAALHCQQVIRDWLVGCDVGDVRCQEVQTWLGLLDKILADELAITRDPTGQAITVQELPKKKKGSYRIASAADPDATFRVHGEQIDFGYNANVAATDTFIHEIRADTGSQPDPVAIPDLLTAQREHHDLTPPKFLYDAAAGTGKSHADVARASHGQTQLVAPLVAYDKRTERFGPSDFVLSPDGQSLTCPNRQVSSTAYASQSGEGRAFRFSADQCQGCPLLQKCRGNEAQPETMRQVFVSDHRSLLEMARTYAQTDAFQKDLRLRATIERIIANLVRYHGARNARRRGRLKCDYQAKMNAMAFNLRQWMRKLERRAATATAVVV